MKQRSLAGPRRLTEAGLLGLLLTCSIATGAVTHPSQADAPAQQPTAAERALLRQSLAADTAERASSSSRAAARPLRSVQPSARTQARPNISNPAIALILDTVAAWFNVDTPTQLGAHDPARSGFSLQQLEMHLQSFVDPYFELQANLVFSQFGVEVEEAYARSLALPGRLQLRAGQFLTRFGRQNSTHPHSWHFADQPLVLGKFLGGEGLRGVGVELSWLATLPWYAELIAGTQMANGACCSRSFLGAQRQAVRTPFDLMQSIRLRQFFAVDRDWSVYWGLSGAFGPNGTGPQPWGMSNRSQLLATDLYVRYRPVESRRRTALSWQTEVVWRQRQVPDRLLEDWGLTSELIWRYALRWETGLRVEHVTGVLADPLDPAWSGRRQRLSAQATWFPSHFARLRLQGSVARESQRESPVFALFLALEVLVGAHGAHPF